MNPAHGRFLPIIDQSEFASYPQSQIGERGIQLAQLTGLELPLIESFILPTTFLEYIAESNQLLAKMEDIFSHTHWKLPVSVEDSAQKIHHAILQQSFPAQAAQVIFTAYEKIIQQDFVSIKPSAVVELTGESQDALAVKGDANFLESLLQVWASVYTPENLAAIHLAWKKGHKVPAALFVQKMVASESTAIVYTHLEAAPGSDTFVRASWGIAPSLHIPITPADTFAVDSHSLKLITSQLQPKKIKVGLSLDALQELPVPREQQFSSSLGPNQLSQIVQYSKALSRQSQTAQKVEWAIQQNQCWLLRARPLQSEEEELLKANFAGKAAQVAAQVNTQPGLPVFSLLTPQLTHTPNQRQVIDTGVIYQTLKLHPYTLIHRRREFLLHNKLRELLPTQNQAQVLFRLCNLTSQQLRELKGGKELEEVETNPAFGYRGALRLLHTHSLLDMELQVVSELAAKHPQRIGIIFPFVRTATELQLLNRHTTQKNWYQLHPLPIWCEIATAAALQEWLEFARVPLAGVVLNFELLTSTMYGIDPDHSDILRLYPSNTELLQSVITQLRSHTPNLQILVQVSDASCRVMECLTQLDVAGVIVR